MTISFAWVLTTFSAMAQTQEQVIFESGNFGTMITGRITGDEYFDYVLGARAGQEMFVELTPGETNGNGIVYLNILPPGSEGEAIYIGSMDDDQSEMVELPDTGEYTIRVYLMGNDRDTGKTVEYNIDLSIQ